MKILESAIVEPEPFGTGTDWPLSTTVALNPPLYVYDVASACMISKLFIVAPVLVAANWAIIDIVAKTIEYLAASVVGACVTG